MSNESVPPEVVPAVSSQNLVFGSLFAALLAIIFLAFVTRSKSKARGNALLLVGAPDSGKTAILSSLLYKRAFPTLSSLQVNTSVVSLEEAPSKTLKIVDIPGHPRTRDQFQDSLADAKAIAFVVDTSTISRNGAAVAEHLHHILHALTSLPPSTTPPALVIVAHKYDLIKTTTSTTSPEDLAITRVKTILERELEKRRVSQTGGVGIEGLGAEGERTELGGLECTGGAFKFSEWEGAVDFVGSWVKIEKEGSSDEKAEDGLASFKSWIGENL